MKRISYTRLAVAAVAACALVLGAGLASATITCPVVGPPGLTCPGNTPTPTGAVLALRVFNDCPTSVLFTTNNYPLLIDIHDTVLDCFGYANLHGWNFSTNGVDPALYENCSFYRYCADVVISGSGPGEGGLRVSPWWNCPQFAVDGRFMLNVDPNHVPVGEIACFGGRLPFFSFTGAFGLNYAKNTLAHMEIIYNPQALTAAAPAYIVYNLDYNNVHYTSGPLYFDQGNLTEAPQHGMWGELNACGVGGYVQCQLGQGTAVDLDAQWSNICFFNEQPTPTKPSSWGQLKSIYR